MTRLTAEWVKGRGWTYTLGNTARLGPKSTENLLRVVHRLDSATARERMQYARALAGRHPGLSITIAGLAPGWT